MNRFPISSVHSALLARTLASAVFATLLLVASAAVAEEAPSISPAELAKLRTTTEAPLVLDVRTEKEFATGHLPGALNIPYDEIKDRLSEIEAPHGVVVHCMVGPRARKGEATLLEADFDGVLHLEGGFRAWQAAGLPVEK